MNELDHVGLYVKDLAKSVVFYGETLGFKVASTMELGEAKIAFLDIGGGLLELIQRPEGPGAPPALRRSHTAYGVNDYDVMESKLEGLGLELRKIKLDNGRRIAFFKDPDDHDVEIMEKAQ
jgi:catechol 2,3-dioxygenase-like lactoylglutathione lyase family enzyme